ncbi:unnamed protein product [Caenorhabditis brenneri]
MRWMSLLIISSLIGYTSSNLALGDLLFNSPKFVWTPLEVPCNQSLCEGPLAEIYCHGEILANSWRLGLEKTCPGDKLRIPAKEVLEKYKKLKYPIKKEDFEKFCNECFEQINYLEVVNLTDWRVDAGFIKDIKNLKYKKLAADLHERWERLARQFTSDVFHHSDLYPLVPVKNAFIVPGGRFDVYFYWDTYWIIKGLLVSEMFNTTRGIIDNFSSLVATLGYIPNSGNLQLTRRSQPPLFPHMVWEFTKTTGQYDMKWIESMETEMKFWEKNRTVTVDGHELFIYRTLSNCPRPENFLGDYNIGMRAPNPSAVWRSISSACESGWDFSSRWMHQNYTADLSSLHTDRIIPVDLNVIIANNYRYMAYYADHFGRFEKSAIYREKFENLSESIQSVLWDESKGAWFDYDLSLKKRNLNFYPSNVYPLMIPGKEKYSNKIESYIKSSGVLNFTGGIPSSLPAHSAQQWDFPNVWAPTQHFLIKSFLASNNSFLKQEARRQADSFIETVYNGLFDPIKGLDGGIWEKYDARSPIGVPGTGGEYIVQEGFGWTNGAVLDLIWVFNDEHTRQDRSETLKINNAQQAWIVYAAGGFCALVAIVVILKGLIRRKSRQQRDDDEAGARLLGDDDDQDEL